MLLVAMLQVLFDIVLSREDGYARTGRTHGSEKAAQGRVDVYQDSMYRKNMLPK